MNDLEADLLKIENKCHTAYNDSLSLIDGLIKQIEDGSGKVDVKLVNSLVKDATDAKAKSGKKFKALHTGVTKYGTTMEKYLIPNLEAALPRVDPHNLVDPAKLDNDLLHRVIIDDFYRQGYFDLATQLKVDQDTQSNSGQSNSGQSNGVGDVLNNKTEQKQTMEEAAFASMHAVQEALKQRKPIPCLEWVKDKLNSIDPSDPLTEALKELKFELHQLEYLTILSAVVPTSTNVATKEEETGDVTMADTAEEKSQQKSGRSAQEVQLTALDYARQHFPDFYNTRMKDIDRLSSCLIYLPCLENSPYQDMFSPIAWRTAWDTVYDLFTKLSLRMLKMPVTNPVVTSLLASSIALPQTLKLCAFIENNKDNATLLNDDDDMTLDIDLGKEHQYHSTFVCPISKTETSQTNPPMLLRCGHVISRAAMLKISRTTLTGREHKFKCPTCPTEQTPSETMALSF